MQVLIFTMTEHCAIFMFEHISLNKQEKQKTIQPKASLSKIR